MDPTTGQHSAWWVYTRPQVILMTFLGFAAGLPFLLVFSTLTAWLNEAGVDKASIGFFAWVGLAYSLKFLWAPLVDRLGLPLLTRAFGQRRGWMLLAQAGIIGGIFGMSSVDPQQDLLAMSLFALMVAFASSTQDIVIDAWRIEAVDRDWQGAMAATYQLGYRIGILVAGAGAFYLADSGMSWGQTYQIMALTMAVGVVTVLLIHEPQPQVDEATRRKEEQVAHWFDGRRNHWQRLLDWFSRAVVAPFVEFFSRNGVYALWILLLIASYRISDITMGIMANPFYLDLGYSKTEIASITKVFGFFMTITGAALGGVLVARFGIFVPLLLGGVMAAVTNLLFAWLAVSEPTLEFLTVVIVADNLSAGLAVTAFLAYLSSLTNIAYTATQYALFSSLMTLMPKFISGFSGIVVESLSYSWFFIYTALLGLPALVLIVVLMRAHNSGRLQLAGRHDEAAT